jgi:hypothetical protein
LDPAVVAAEAGKSNLEERGVDVLEFSNNILTLFFRFVHCSGGAAAGGAEEEVVEEKKEEEEEMDLGGGMDMFGGEEAGGGDY